MQLNFDLAKKGGMMRKFTGAWKIEPMTASEAAPDNLPTTAAAAEGSPAPGSDDPIVGSWVTFQQVVEPSITPPWPLSSYIRGITEKIVRDMLADLQRECQRLAELQKPSTSPSPPPSASTSTEPAAVTEVATTANGGDNS